jgi:hypothetical protein
MYIPKYFSVKELVSRHIYEKNMARGRSPEWMFSTLLDERLLKTIDILRDQFGPMTINDWYLPNGSTHYRGFRSPGCSVGADLSQHRFGRAADIIPRDVSAKDIRDDIINQQNIPDFKYIGGLEMDVLWLHVDVRARDAQGNIRLFYP